jgi:hypothetical protein
MMNKLVAAWNKFWFEPVPTTSVCLYRIGLGVLAFCNGILYIPNFDYWFGQPSMVPMHVVSQMVGGARLGIFQYWQPDNTTLYGLLGLYILLGFFLAIGFLTRTSTALLWLLAVSFRHRDPFLWHSIDFMLILMLQLLFFTPAGSRFSVDAWLKNRFSPNSQPVTMFSPWAQRLMQVQETAVYFFAFWGKFYGQTWWQGSAVYYAVRGDFIKFGLPPLLDNPIGYHFLSWGTLAMEFSLWSLIWIKPLRYWVLAAGIVFHLLLNWSLDIDFLEHIMMLGYINFIYPDDLERALGWIKQRIQNLGLRLRPVHD